MGSISGAEGDRQALALRYTALLRENGLEADAIIQIRDDNTVEDQSESWMVERIRKPTSLSVLELKEFIRTGSARVKVVSRNRNRSVALDPNKIRLASKEIVEWARDIPAADPGPVTGSKRRRLDEDYNAQPMRTLGFGTALRNSRVKLLDYSANYLKNGGKVRTLLKKRTSRCRRPKE
jgi:hypothetical protein